MNSKRGMKRWAIQQGFCRHAGALAMALALNGVPGAWGHSDLTTHPKLMDYAVQLAKSDPNLALPIAGNMAAPGQAWTRMKEGSRQEDEGIRCRAHFYNPMHGCPVLTTTVAIGWDRHLHNFRRCYLQVVDQ